MIQAGDELIVDHDVIGISGITHLTKGQAVKVRSVQKMEGFWGKRSGEWYPSKILTIGIEGFEESVFLPTVFEETKDL